MSETRAPRRSRIMRVVALVALALIPSAPVFADAAGPTDYSTSIFSIEPDVSDVAHFSVVGSDAFMAVNVDPGHDLVVYGYDDEPYIKIDRSGLVYENRLSESYYYNQERFGGEVPPEADSSAAPRWVEVDDDGEYAWHDHRAHWMAGAPLVGMNPGDSLPPQTIPMAVDGEPVELQVITTLRAQSSPVWPIIGLLIGGALAVAAIVMPRRWLLPSGYFAAALALLAGVSQTLSLPASAGRPLSWWALPAVAVVTMVISFVFRDDIRRWAPLSVGAGIELVVWSWRRLGGITAYYRPTTLPVDLDRMITVLVLAVGVGMIIGIGRVLLRRNRRRVKPTADAAY